MLRTPGDGRLPQMLVAECNGPAREAALRAVGWGRMWVEKRPVQYDDTEAWGFDNGAWLAKSRGTAWDADAFLRRLDRAVTRYLQGELTRPLLCVTPDIWGGGLRSLDLSLEWIAGDRLPREVPWYLAVQDGQTPDDVRPHLRHFDGVFIGGSNTFRERWAYQFCLTAHVSGLPFHFGRCGNPTVWRLAYRIGADSCDSSTPVQASPARAAALRRIWQGLVDQPDLIGSCGTVAN